MRALPVKHPRRPRRATTHGYGAARQQNPNTDLPGPPTRPRPGQRPPPNHQRTSTTRISQPTNPPLANPPPTTRLADPGTAASTDEHDIERPAAGRRPPGPPPRNPSRTTPQPAKARPTSPPPQQPPIKPTSNTTTQDLTHARTRVTYDRPRSKLERRSSPRLQHRPRAPTGVGRPFVGRGTCVWVFGIRAVAVSASRALGPLLVPVLWQALCPPELISPAPAPRRVAYL